MTRAGFRVGHDRAGYNPIGLSNALSIPMDPHERRRLWRQWIHADAPQGERVQRPVVRRAVALPEAESNPAANVEAPAERREDWLGEVLSAPPSVIAGLKRAIDESLVGPILPIADRERLIRRAIKLGLNRFEANLMIAAVQNRALQRTASAAPSERSGPAHRKWTLAGLLTALLLGEGIAIVALLRML